MKVSRRGQVTIPKQLRERYGLTPGTAVEFVEEENSLRLQKVRTGKHPVWGLIGTLGRNESTDEFIEQIRGR